METNGIEKKYALFFASAVRVFLFIMLAAFIFNLTDILLHSDKAADIAVTAVEGGELERVYLSHRIILSAVMLLSASLLISFSYLVYLFYRRREYVYSFITAALVLIISTSAVLSFL